MFIPSGKFSKHEDIDTANWANNPLQDGFAPLVAHRNGGKVDIGGGRIDDLLAEVDAGLLNYERMLVRYKNEIAAAVMESAEADAETNRPSLVFREPNRREERG
jgi:hypothetical protein